MLAASGSNAMTSDRDDIVDIIPAFYDDVWNKWKIKQNYSLKTADDVLADISRVDVVRQRILKTQAEKIWNSAYFRQ